MQLFIAVDEIIVARCDKKKTMTYDMKYKV